MRPGLLVYKVKMLNIFTYDKVIRAKGVNTCKAPSAVPGTVSSQ